MGESTRRIEIVSFRPVFDFERRFYGTDQFRWPSPHGLPVRAIGYFALALLIVQVASRLPLIGLAVDALPWVVRYVIAPGALAWLATVARVQGRWLHHAARALIAHAATPRRVVAMRPGREPERWRPGRILLLPDGREGGGFRSVRFTGPGEVLICYSATATRQGRKLTVAQTGVRPRTRGAILEVPAGAEARFTAG